MKRTLLPFCILFCMTFAMQAQDQPLINPDDSIRSLLGRVFPNNNPELSSHMNFQFYTSGSAYFTEGELDEAAFKLNRVRLEILGSFSKQFSYHFRQSFNKYSNPHSLDNLSSSIEYAFVDWKMSDRFTFQVGKQNIALGGYEYYVSSIKVREFSEFNNNISCYQAGVTGMLALSPTQELVLQVANNRSGEDEDTYLHGLPAGVAKTKLPIISSVNWNGYFLDKAVQLRYAASWGQLADNKNLYYLTAGNIYEKGPIVTYVDLMYSREGLDSKGIISDLQGPAVNSPVTAQNAEYFTTIANFDYRVHPNWNLYVKGAYETARVYKANGLFDKGLYRTTWNAQACVEYFPMRNSELLIFAHLLYKGHHLTSRAKALGGISPDTQRISIGLVYSIPVF
ncbi:porin [Phocaeicola sp.]